MLRKIDCIMIRVENVETAASYYADVFGLHPRWSGDGSIGLVFQEADAEIVLHCDPSIPRALLWLPGAPAKAPNRIGTRVAPG
jgi:catechol 2,3-dioxygenase-like lactoylglutathione lyase family enzyme